MNSIWIKLQGQCDRQFLSHEPLPPFFDHSFTGYSLPHHERNLISLDSDLCMIPTLSKCKEKISMNARDLLFPHCAIQFNGNER